MSRQFTIIASPSLQSRQLQWVIPLSLAALGVWLFVALLLIVQTSAGSDIEHWLLTMWRQPDDLAATVGPAWLCKLAIHITNLATYPVVGPMILLSMGFLLVERRYTRATMLLCTGVGAAILARSFKALVARPRPTVVPHLVDIRPLSFPSEHALMAGAVFMTIAVLLARTTPVRWQQMLFLTGGVSATLLVGLSRVFLGVHYLTDVMAGWSLALAWASLTWLVADLIEDKSIALLKR